jgi:hypothetical protein
LFTTFIAGAAMAVMVATGQTDVSTDAARHDVVATETGKTVLVDPDCWRVGSEN